MSAYLKLADKSIKVRPNVDYCVCLKELTIPQAQKEVVLYKKEQEFNMIKNQALMLINEQISIEEKMFKTISDFLCLELLEFYTKSIDILSESALDLAVQLSKFYKLKRLKNNLYDYLNYYEGKFSAIADLYQIQIRKSGFQKKLNQSSRIREIIYGARNNNGHTISITDLDGKLIDDLDWMKSNELVLISNRGNITVKLSKNGRRVLNEVDANNAYYCFYHNGNINKTELRKMTSIKKEEYYIKSTR